MRKAAAAVLAGAIVFAGGSAPVASDLPAGLSSPDQRVVCNPEREICYDRYGPSIGLTEAFLGREAAERLTARLRKEPPDHRPGALFSPAEGVECVRETGPCRVSGQTHVALAAVLYGPWPMRKTHSAEAQAIIGAEWKWGGTRYCSDTEARPPDPARYRLLLAPDGSVRIQADCNRAGGQYRLDGSTIAVQITHSTMAACGPGSLERVFLRDLSAAAVYFMKSGRLYLDLKYDTGTMEFER